MDFDFRFCMLDYQIVTFFMCLFSIVCQNVDENFANLAHFVDE